MYASVRWPMMKYLSAAMVQLVFRSRQERPQRSGFLVKLITFGRADQFQAIDQKLRSRR